MRSLRWLCGVPRVEKRFRFFSHTRMRGTVRVAEVSKKAQETRLRWCGQHVTRRDGESDERRALEVEIQGGRTGRPRTRWKYSTAADMEETHLPNMTRDRPV